MPEQLNEILQNPWLTKAIELLIGIVVVFLIRSAIQRALTRVIKDNSSRYTARKATNFLSYLLIAAMVAIVFSDKLGNIGVALGVAGAGIAFALQEVIMSIAGWINIMFSNMISVGQRVKIGNVKGDIIDIGIFNTTVMEIGDWVKGDLYNGRIVTLANSFVFNETIHNYSAEYPFLWDEVEIPIRHSSDYRLAHDIFQNILEQLTGDYARESRDQWLLMARKFRVEEARVEPMVTLVFDENWTTYTLRYIVDYKQRRSAKDKIFRAALDEIAQTNGKVQIATAAMEITQV
ncbi:MAG: mechanosensitive ion channel [Salibacteraceae bacterium]